MPALSGQDRQSLDAALDFVLKLLECLQRVPADKNTIKPSDADAIRRMVEELKRMAADGRIDWQRADDAIAAETDGNGIHLNPSFGGDYRNDYQLPGDYHLDDCREGYFASLWRILEILFHELYHYDRHSGVLRGLFKVFVVVAYGVAEAIVSGLARLFGEPLRLKRRYVGHEHQAYSATYFLLGRLDHMLFLVCTYVPDCIPCCDEHRRWLREARERQQPYEW